MHGFKTSPRVEIRIKLIRRYRKKKRPNRTALFLPRSPSRALKATMPAQGVSSTISRKRERHGGALTDILCAGESNAYTQAGGSRVTWSRAKSSSRACQRMMSLRYILRANSIQISARGSLLSCQCKYVYKGILFAPRLRLFFMRNGKNHHHS